MYDFIIIGGGIAGLYMNYLLTDKYKTLLLEKNNHLGGRIFQDNFHNYKINTGARIGNLHNTELLKLLQKLNIQYKILNYKIIILNKKINMYQMVKSIKDKYNEITKLSNKNLNNISAREFIIEHFGIEFFKLYSNFTEYTDFFNQSINTYIHNYPINDHIPKISEKDNISINWNLLVKKLIKKIKKKNKIIKNYEVKNIIYNKKTLQYNINNKFIAKNIIICVTLKQLNKLIKKSNLDIPKNYYNKYIGSVPFLRIYTYHKNGHNINLNKYNITGTKLNKIIIENNKILTILETDYKNALYWKQFINNKTILINKIKRELQKITNIDIKIDDIKIIYWDDGIHYFKPSNINIFEKFDELINPLPNFYVCGEIISTKQGWVEGALKTVNFLYKKLK
jgi:protoporphyrinogen oxidase